MELLRLSLAMAGVSCLFCSECVVVAEMFNVARHSGQQLSLKKVGDTAGAKHRVKKIPVCPKTVMSLGGSLDRALVPSLEMLILLALRQ